MDALKIPTAVIGGFDWGARTADIVAAAWPQRVKALVSVSGYLIVNLEANQQPLPPQAELRAGGTSTTSPPTAGCAATGRYAHDFNKLIWHNASPTWKFDDATYDRTAAAFTNPDHVDIVIHNYRWRLKLAQGEPRYDDLDAKLAAKPVITVPTITIGSDFDGPAKDGASYRQHVHRQVLAPRARRHRAQRPTGSAPGLRRCHHRSRQQLNLTGLATDPSMRRRCRWPKGTTLPVLASLGPTANPPRAQGRSRYARVSSYLPNATAPHSVDCTPTSSARAGGTAHVDPR